MAAASTNSSSAAALGTPSNSTSSSTTPSSSSSSSSGGGGPVGKTEVSRAAEDKLTYKLCLAAEVRCADLIAAYNECVAGRTLTAAWACKRLYRESSACISHYVNADNIETLKRRWVDAGRPQWPDWSALLDGLVEPQHRAKPQRPQ